MRTHAHSQFSLNHPRLGGTGRRPQAVYGADKVGLVGFHNRGFVIHPFTELYHAKLQQRILSLHTKVAGTGTNITDGLRRGLTLLGNTPKGVLRRAWLLTDGYPNIDTGNIYAVIDQARQAHVNVNTIGFGDIYDEALLKRLSASTHNGRFVSVQSLRQLTDALGVSPERPTRHRAEHTVYIIDCSPSMVFDQMNGRRKIDVVQDALIQLINYKVKCFA